MEKIEFKKLLFKIAFCTMGCDGDIDPLEIEEMKSIDKNTSFFNDVDLSLELEQLIIEFKGKGIQLVSEMFEELDSTELNPIQELILLEVALRLINADGKHDENEKRFIQHLRAHLKVHDEEILERFGEVDILHVNPYAGRIRDSGSKKVKLDIKMPDEKSLKKIDFKFD
ncbi:hypothetical protein [Colwellia sp. BRX8-9]|uniref:hypothetical protein n=1 Tax=Colwellia sp. BRX8-9 TaxID=2759831 RepID=UPI0015F5F589|nr:hypothetical protein [Colwellia sp. BRX8-9]MBA6348340.1 hypothetical protein [Colwellia sp. BRX8-9]